MSNFKYQTTYFNCQWFGDTHGLAERRFGIWMTALTMTRWFTPVGKPLLLWVTIKYDAYIYCYTWVTAVRALQTESFHSYLPAKFHKSQLYTKRFVFLFGKIKKVQILWHMAYLQCCKARSVLCSALLKAVKHFSAITFEFDMAAERSNF